MRILLIQPHSSPSTIGADELYMHEPLALEYIAAGVISEHDVKILDMRLEWDLKGVLDGFRPDVVGITAYTVNVNIVKGLFREIKRWNPEVFTVVGGHHATVSPEDFLSSDIDIVVMGEGVFVFRELIRRIEKKEGFEGIKGIIYKRDGSIIKNPPEPVADLDAFPFPERRLTERYRREYFTEWMKPLASVRTSKG